MEPPQLVGEFVGQIDSAEQPSAWVRHYNFVDMTRYGALWNPLYFNVVRDPIDKVIMEPNIDEEQCQT